MIFRSKNELIGLDIGSRTIKAGEVAETNKGLILKRFGMAEIPPGMIEEGTVNDPEGVSRCIKNLLKDHNFKSRNVAVSIGGYSVIVKKIVMAAMEEEQAQETIPFEAEQYIPFDIADVNLDFEILGPNEHNPNQMNVLLVAAKKEMIDGFVNLVNMADLNPCVVDVDAFALQNIFKANYDAVEENVALIDIGYSKTSLNILKDETSVFMRDVSLGCGQIDQQIASKLACSVEEAEKIKLTRESDRISAEQLAEIVTSIVSEWCLEIRRALDFFYSTYPEDQIQKIILSGGGGHIQEFRQLLSIEASADVKTIDPFQKIHTDEKIFEKRYLEEIAPQAGICLGLALRKVNDK